jgi:predicted TPR repeat methyltransferase
MFRSRRARVRALLTESEQLHQEGRLAEARTGYEEILAIDPDYAEAIHLLGLAVFQQNEPDAALRLLLRAIELQPRNADFLTNLGNVYAALGRPGEALDAYESARKRRPGDADIHINIGIVHFQGGATEKAEQCFRAAICADLHAAEPHFRLGNVLAAQGRFSAAFDEFLLALELAPGRADVHAGIGKIFLALHRPRDAEPAFRKARELDPASPAYRRDLARALFFQNRFKEASAVDPDQFREPHMAAAALGATTECAPRDYVVGLFDNYAARYEEHLVNMLQYRAPWLIRDSLLRAIPAGRRFANALDLGCGTGLAGTAVRDLVDRLTGVDLSSKMAEKAGGKNAYDRLKICDIRDFLNETRERFDLVVSADVLVYVGNLQPFFGGLRRCLMPGGYAAFSTEFTEAPEYMLCKTGRYAHSRSYLESFATEQEFEVLRMDAAEIRQEAGKPVPGTITVLR